MILLAFKSITYHSNLSQDEIIERLHELIEVRTSLKTRLLGDPPTKRYVGEINKTGFRIKRVISGRNSFRPIISGNIHQNSQGTIIKCEMHPGYQAIITISLFFLIFGFASILFYLSSLINHDNNGTYLEILAIMITIYVIAILGFNIEANRSKKDLYALFKN